MKRTLLVLSLVSLAAIAAPAVDTQGARKGVWSSDYPAVMAAAKADNACVFVLFTGSDWCYWCKLLDTNVFSKTIWKEFAFQKLYLAYIDFPKDESKITETVHNQNAKLKEDFNVDGYPTMLLLDCDGNKFDEFHAEQNITPEKFISKVKRALLFEPSELEATYKLMPAEQVATIKENTEKLKQLDEKQHAAEEIYEQEQELAKEKYMKASMEIQKQRSEVPDPKAAVIDYLLKTKAPEAYPKYQELMSQRKDLVTAGNEKLKELASNPQTNNEESFKPVIEEYTQKFQSIDKQLDALIEQIFQ
ncbi:MAG: thioredoxin family protein [Victivallales bacterium]|nr:thioredoxin family protein [Victivallales bacterium]